MKAHRGSLWWHCCGLATVSALGFAACGGSGRSNTVASRPIAPTTSTPTNKWSTAGQVVATGSEQNVGGATLTPGWSLAPVTADCGGELRARSSGEPPSSPPYPLTISQSGFISHDVWITWQLGPRTNVTLDLIRDAPPFSTDFYREFIRDMYDKSDGSPWPLQRWTTPPSFYVRTLDDTGHPVESGVIDTTIDALRRGVSGYTAGRYAVAAVATGTEVRPGAADWINVDFMHAESSDTCGTAYVGRNPGTITLYLDVCGCGSVRVLALGGRCTRSSTRWASFTFRTSTASCIPTLRAGVGPAPCRPPKPSTRQSPTRVRVSIPTPTTTPRRSRRRRD